MSRKTRSMAPQRRSPLNPHMCPKDGHEALAGRNGSRLFSAPRVLRWHPLLQPSIQAQAHAIDRLSPPPRQVRRALCLDAPAMLVDAPQKRVEIAEQIERRHFDDQPPHLPELVDAQSIAPPSFRILPVALAVILQADAEIVIPEVDPPFPAATSTIS